MNGPRTLAEAHAGYQTRLRRADRGAGPPWLPPEEIFRLVRYRSPAGGMAAYAGHLPPTGLPPRPAVIWLAGEFACSLDENLWLPAVCDCTSQALRDAGVFVLQPGLRGWDDNPGCIETFFGELDDIVAAADELSRRRGIDPQRIYLAGHSTGGTLALLSAEYSQRFRAVFSFGPVDEVTHYPEDRLTFDPADLHEAAIRSPIHWLRDIRTPTFVFEGTEKSNHACLRRLAEAPRSESVSFHSVPKANHFSLVEPLCWLIAQKILLDKEETVNIAFTDEEIARALDL